MRGYAETKRRRPGGGEKSLGVSPRNVSAGSPRRRRRREQQRRYFAALIVFSFSSLVVCCIVIPWNVFQSSDQPKMPGSLRASATEKDLLLNDSIRGLHEHSIPNIILFTHYTNLLEADIPADQQQKNLTAEETELKALQGNVKRIVSLHPGAPVRFLTDNDCIQSIRAVMGMDTLLVDYFLKEKQGMFKADLCRGAALWETGGLYFDVDLGVRMNIFDALKKNTSFATVRVHGQSKHKGAFFQAFIGCTARHPVIHRYMQLFLDYYEGRLPDVNGPLGVLLLRRAFDDVIAKQPKIKHESEIWQEVLYLPEHQDNILKDVPPPVWGTRRACKFVILTAPKMPPVVPLYSRIAGSRMCPADVYDDRYDKYRERARNEALR